jgi:phytoene dehydrogenase-like protein
MSTTVTLTTFLPDCSLEFPVGGSEAMVNCLINGLVKHGGELRLRSHVDQVGANDHL